MLLNDVILSFHVSCETIRNSCLKEVFGILSEVFSSVLLRETLFSQCRQHRMVPSSVILSVRDSCTEIEWNKVATSQLPALACEV